MFSGMRSTDVVTPAQYLVQASNDLLRAARDNDPDITRMVVAKDKANALVNNQKLRNAVEKQATQNEIDFAEKLSKVDDRISGEIAKIEASTNRKAGILSLLGTGAMAGVMNQQNIIRKEERAEDKRIFSEQIAAQRDLLNKPMPNNVETLLKKFLEENKNNSSSQDASTTSSTDLPSAPNTAPAVSTNSSTPQGIRGQVFSYLTNDKKLSKNQALGLMANIDRESSFRPSIRSGDDGGFGGLFQWKGVRQTPTVQNLVKSGDWKGQIDYALSEPSHLSAVIPGLYQSLKFDSPQQAADWWMNNWERPADKKSGSIKHSQFLAGYNF